MKQDGGHEVPNPSQPFALTAKWRVNISLLRITEPLDREQLLRKSSAEHGWNVASQ